MLSGVNGKPRVCICEWTLPMQTPSSCSGSPASQRNGSNLPFLTRREAPSLEEAPAVSALHAAAPPGSMQPAPAEPRLCSAPSQPCALPPSVFHLHGHESRLRLSSRQPGPRQHFYVSACAYANAHAHTVVSLWALIQETWEELRQRASWRKSTDIYRYIYINWGK